MHELKPGRGDRARIAGCLAIALCVAGCEGLPDLAPRPIDAAPPRPQVVAPVAPPMPQDPLETIARHEDARSDGDGLLAMLVERGEESTRQRAAIALGRLPFPEHGRAVSQALTGALDDESPGVRAAAAFALGMRADPGTAAALLEHHDDPDELVRARIVEAASRVDDPRLRTLVLGALDDPSLLVRAEAALAPHRWTRAMTPPAADAVDEALVEALNAPAQTETRPTTAPATIGTEALTIAAADREPEVAYRALFSLARRKSERGRTAFRAALDARDVRARIFALQGFASIAADSESQSRVRQALRDREWRVVVEAARALGAHPDADTAVALAGLLGHASTHVRRAAVEALGACTASKDAALQALERADADSSSNVKAAALEARAKLAGDESRDVLQATLTSADPLLRGGVAAALGHTSAEFAVPRLITLSADPDLRVAGIAIESLGKHAQPSQSPARQHLRALLAAPDNGLRLQALLTLRETQVADDLPFLEACYATSSGDIAAEIAYSALESAAKLDAPGVRALLERGCTHPNAYVRKRARELFAQRHPHEPLPRATVVSARAAHVPLAGREFPPHLRNPRVEVRTNRGSMLFELFPTETPVHVFSFLELARVDAYDGTLFHRVASNFVIQGGDPRGDGNGGASWRGDALRAEFTPRKFVRGSLGMPRNDDPDSGGSQIFVTHRETPHLDGRYTLFGELRDGFDVLDAIEVGDVIQDVRILGTDDSR